MNHPLHREVLDLPGLHASADGPVLQLPEVDLDALVAAVVARQRPGARLQEKADGCWACAHVGVDGTITSITARSGKPLRQGARWRGQFVGYRWGGWTIIGELETGTSRAKARRRSRGESTADSLDPWHVYGLVDPRGLVFDGPELGMLVAQLASTSPHGRIQAIHEALPGEPWAEFTRRVMNAGGEGVVVIEPDGTRYRAKPQVDLDRAVLGIVEHIDRRGRVHLQARIGVCTSAGARPRFRETQVVELPKGTRRSELPRGAVVSIVGSSVDLQTGVVQFARIVGIRTDKAAADCRVQ